MIVRIPSEGQFKLDDSEAEQLNQIDDSVVTAVEAGDEDSFKTRFTELYSFVRERGERLPDQELVASDLILPPEDLSFAEAQQEFTGEGLIPFSKF